MLNIPDHNTIFNILSELKKDTPRKFGKMSAQHMVEHLSYAMTFSNGKDPQQLMVHERLARAIKHHTINTSEEMGIGFKAPMLGDEPPPLLHGSLETAIEQLKKEMQDFDNYFKNSPKAKFISPVLGELDHAEWIIFHNKHFTHHFKQFGLL